MQIVKLRDSFLYSPFVSDIAVAHTILTIGYHMLQRGTVYQDLGANYFDQRHLLRTTKRLVKRLEALGHRVILESPVLDPQTA